MGTRRVAEAVGGPAKAFKSRLCARVGNAIPALKRPWRGLKTLPPASATINGYEVMRMIRKRQCLTLEFGTTGQVCLVNRLFRFAA
jgi:hypothetical protein